MNKGKPRRRRQERVDVVEVGAEQVPSSSEPADAGDDGEMWEEQEVEAYEVVAEVDDGEDGDASDGDERTCPGCGRPGRPQEKAERNPPAAEAMPVAPGIEDDEEDGEEKGDEGEGGEASEFGSEPDMLKETLKSYVRDLQEIFGSLRYLDPDEEEETRLTHQALAVLHEAVGFVNGLELGEMLSVEQAAELRGALEAAADDIEDGRPQVVLRHLQRVADALVEL